LGDTIEPLDDLVMECAHEYSVELAPKNVWDAAVTGLLLPTRIYSRHEGVDHFSRRENSLLGEKPAGGLQNLVGIQQLLGRSLEILDAGNELGSRQQQRMLHAMLQHHPNDVSHNSREDVFDLFLASSPQELEPPQNPGRFKDVKLIAT
jgi:hypothetical protein